MSEVDTSDSKLLHAFNALKDTKNPHNWLSYGLVGKSKALELSGTGEGGLAQMVESFTDDRVYFALLRAIGSDVQANVVSNREKFVYICWIGHKVPVLQRAKVGMQSKSVQAFFKGVSLVVSVDANDKKDLDLEILAKRLLACGGAHKPTKYIFGPGQEYSLLDLLGAAGPRGGFVPPTSPSSPPSSSHTSSSSSSTSSSSTEEHKEAPTSPPAETAPVADPPTEAPPTEAAPTE